MPRRGEAAQLALELPSWGGRRRGAGRKPAGARRRAPHVAREKMKPYQPVHVTFRVLDDVWSLRSERAFRVLGSAIRGAQRRPGFRVVHFTVMGNHLHLIVEADGPRTLALRVRGLAVRVARGLNRMMGRIGPVFADRYDAHVLRTPAEVRNAVQYVLGNYESHAARRGEARSTKGWIDPFSSAAGRGARREQLELFEFVATARPRTWLLRKAG